MLSVRPPRGPIVGLKADSAVPKICERKGRLRFRRDRGSWLRGRGVRAGRFLAGARLQFLES